MSQFILDLLVHFGLPTVGVVVGAAIAWTRLKGQQEDNTNDIADLKTTMSQVVGTPVCAPLFIRRTECRGIHETENTKIIEIEKHLADHCQSIKGMQNFAVWFLTTKEGMSLTEAKAIINGKA